MENTKKEGKATHYILANQQAHNKDMFSISMAPEAQRVTPEEHRPGLAGSSRVPDGDQRHLGTASGQRSGHRQTRERSQNNPNDALQRYLNGEDPVLGEIHEEQAAQS